MEKSGKGKVIAIIILLIICLGLGGYITYRELNPKQIIKTKTITKEVNDSSLKEGYIKFEDDYKIYGLNSYVQLSSVIVGYKNNLYYIDASGDQDLSQWIKQLPKLNFDDKGSVINISENVKIYKYKGKESDLRKVIFKSSVESTDGYKIPTLFYKNGSVESNNDSIQKALKNFKVKDIIEEKCLEKSDSIAPECKKLSYKVILLNGTTKTITLEN